MMWTAGEDVTLSVDYIVDGAYVIPESAQASVRDNSGALIVGMVDVPLAVDSTTTELSIPGQHNIIDPNKDFERRYISLSFLHEGKRYQKVMQYELQEFLPISADAQSVRRTLGLDPLELPDADVNIRAAYLNLVETYGDPIVEALTTGDVKTIAVNKAITLSAAMELLNSLPFRVAIKMKAEDSSVERMSDFDIGKMRIQLGQEMSYALDLVLDTSTGGSAILVLTSPTDAITGE